MSILREVTGTLTPEETSHMQKICEVLQCMNQKNVNQFNQLDREMSPYNGRVYGVKIYSTLETSNDDGLNEEEVIEFWQQLNQLDIKYISALYQMSSNMPNSAGLVPPPCGKNAC